MFISPESVFAGKQSLEDFTYAIKFAEDALTVNSFHCELYVCCLPRCYDGMIDSGDTRRQPVIGPLRPAKCRYRIRVAKDP